MKVIKENLQSKTIWDIFIILLILISSIIIPFQAAFEQTTSDQENNFIYLIDLFLVIDIYFNFFTTYRFQGEEVVDAKKIHLHYLKSTFLVDLIANFPFDLMVLLLFPSAKVYNISLVLILRLFRLLRIVRLFRIFGRWENQRWINPGYFRISKLFIFVLLLTHWLACIWFAIAYIDNFPQDSWVVRSEIENASPAKQYILSLYWAFTTMTTIGYGDITPKRTIEYIATIIIMLLGASIYAFIIGNIASLISELDTAKLNYRNKTEALIQYLRYQQVPKELVSKISNYYEYLWARDRGFNEENLFRDLPPSSRLEVLQYITRELLQQVPLFKYCSPGLRNILLSVLKVETYAPNSYIVFEGELGEAIYFITKGKVEIIIANSNEFIDQLGEGEYFGDISLVLKEKRTASVRTISYCDLFVLTEKDFIHIKNKYPEFKEVLKQSAAHKSEKMAELILKDIIL